MRRAKRLQLEVREIREQLETTRKALHESQIAEAAVRGELRGFTRAIDHTTIAAREAARAGLPFTTEARR